MSDEIEFTPQEQELFAEEPADAAVFVGGGDASAEDEQAVPEAGEPAED